MSLSPHQHFARTSLLRWRRSKNYARNDMLPRMSWHPKNLYNIWNRATTYSPEPWRLGANKITVQRTLARRLVMGYHCQHVTATQLRRKYLQAPPTYRIKAFRRQPVDDPLIKTPPPFTDSRPLPAVPYSSLLFSEVERRLDSVLFRSCLVPSIYEARTLIAKGYVRVEEAIVRSPGFAMEPGMMFSVEPRHLKWGLHPNWESRYTPNEPVASGEAETQQEEAEALQEAETQQEVGTEVAEESGKDAVAAPPPPPPPPPPTSQEWREATLEFRLPRWAAPMVFMPSYLEVNFRACAGVYVRHPTAKPGISEIPSPWDAMEGEMFSLFHEYWRPLSRNHRVRPVLPPGMKRNVWKRETARQRRIGQGDALTVEHLGRIRQATRDQDEKYLRSYPKAEGSERRARIEKMRTLRQQRYTAGRLATNAVPHDRALRVPPNRYSRAPTSSRRGAAVRSAAAET